MDDTLAATHRPEGKHDAINSIRDARGGTHHRRPEVKSRIVREHKPEGPLGHSLWTTSDWVRITDRHGCEVVFTPAVAVLLAESILLAYRDDVAEPRPR